MNSQEQWVDVTWREPLWCARNTGTGNTLIIPFLQICEANYHFETQELHIVYVNGSHIVVKGVDLRCFNIFTDGWNRELLTAKRK